MPEYSRVPIGGFRVVFEYADFLADRGHAVTVVFPRRLSTQKTRPLQDIKRHLRGIKNRMLNRPLIPWHRLHPKVRLAFTRDLRDGAIPDADASVATAWSTAFPVADLSRSKGKKFYLIQHYEIWSGPEDQVNATWRLPLRKIVIAKWLEEIGGKLGARDMRYIPNGIDFHRFRVTNPPDQRPNHILSIYHDAKFKGVSDALAVLKKYHEQFPEVPVSMFGVPHRVDEMPDWIAYCENPPQTELVNHFYNVGSIYLGASLAEGWALPPAEAMACGCVFVGTDIGGFREYAIHNDTALLCPAGDREGMLRNLVAVTEDGELRHRLQKRGTEYIRQFTWGRAGTALEQYLME